MSKSTARPPDNRQASGFNFNSTSSPAAHRSTSNFNQSDDSKFESPHQNWPRGKTMTKNPTNFPSLNPPSAEMCQAASTQRSMAEAQEIASHLALLKAAHGRQDQHELSETPIFTASALQHSKHLINQYGFIAGISEILEQNSSVETVPLSGDQSDPRLFFNISAPSSALICGSQGSGKSHTLSCLLENCLIKSHVSKLENPLTGLVFHYDHFPSDSKGRICEAAHLSSNPNIKVRLLCSPASLQTIKRTYHSMNVQIEPLKINQSDLNSKRMMDLLATAEEDRRTPPYLNTVQCVLHEMHVIQQMTDSTFDYREFKRRVQATGMDSAQLALFMDKLELFVPKLHTGEMPKTTVRGANGNSWISQPGTLTIVDLSCPCVTPEEACALFNLCLSLFLERGDAIGRVVALDEAHKYMTAGPAANILINTLLSSIRLQRHLGTRVFISTQEPTISPKLLDLCSFTIVHRFSSPDWLRCLKSHLAALNTEEDSTHTQETKTLNVFNQIVILRVGEALLFAPSATIGIENGREMRSVSALPKMKKLGLGYMKIKIRDRITADGGRGFMATSTSSTAVDFKTVKPSPIMSKTPVASTTTPNLAPATQPQAAMPSTSTFGAPSPNPRVFDGIRSSAPMPPAVADLKTRGMLGFGHNPPVTRRANMPAESKMPENENLVHGTGKNNIFGHLKPGNTAANSAHGTMATTVGTVQKENIPSNKANSAEPSLPTKSKNLASTIYSSPEFTLARVLKPTPNPPNPATETPPRRSPYADALSSSSCPGTWGSVFTSHVEKEANNPTGMLNAFQHMCFSRKFVNYSQEELRLMDYAIFVCQMKDTLLAEYRG